MRPILLVSLLGVLSWPVAASGPAVIPNPARLEAQAGRFALTPGTVLVVPAGDAEARRAAELLRERIALARGLKPALATGAPRDGAINLRRATGAALPPEGYRLEVTPRRITLEATSYAGLFHAGTTLLQLLPPGRDAAAIPAVRIEDAPRFAWRGVMLDSARHFQSPAFIRHFIDAMALHKLNVLHWHLTDDQAWRLEIRKYPKLTGVGAWRVPAGAAPRSDLDAATGKPRLYGGFYSQDEVRSLVKYAAERAITIVPEIEMPGHATTAIAAYPQLAAIANPPQSVPADWGVYPHAYNLDDATFAFLEDVLAEVMALFPGPYIHVGGDEVQKAEWRDSAQGQARMRELGVTEPAKLQAYFTQRIARFIEKNGRKLVGWDEILEPGLPPGAVVMSWRGIEGALDAAAKGYDTVLSAHPTLYFDNRQSAARDEPPGRGNVVTLEDVYRFEPMPEKLAPGQRRHVLGLQGNVWTEHIRTEARVAHMAFPRAAAVAELGWSQPQRREWRDFVRRLASQVPRYEALRMASADSAFAVRAALEWRGGRAQARLTLSNEAGYGDIRYTADGTEPTAKSARYAAPLTVGTGRTLKAASFDAAQRLSRPRAIEVREDLARRRTSRELKLCSEHIALALEDDAPLHGERASFLVDIQNPCWIYAGAELDGVGGLVASVGQLPFNFQIGEDVKKITFPRPETAAGELEVRLGCDGELLARLALEPATASQAVTVLPRAAIAPRAGRHDLCLRFAQAGLDPFWVIDAIQLVP
jgi:hexosaminidase